MATEAIRVGINEAIAIKVVSERLNITKEEALKRIFEIAIKNLI
jgi:hypothetical protein